MAVLLDGERVNSVRKGTSREGDCLEGALGVELGRLCSGFSVHVCVRKFLGGC